MTPFLQQGFEKYKKGGGPEVFAIAENGSSYGYTYCVSGIGGCQVGVYFATAINSCEERSTASCKIHAVCITVVWNGSATSGTTNNMRR